MTKRAIVTGGSGFIGSHLIQILIEKYQFTVLNIDKLTYASDPSALLKFSDHPDYAFLKEDISDQKAILKPIKSFKPDVIFHLAAESHVDRSISSAEAFMHSNILGTYSLLEVVSSLMKTNELPDKFRFIHVSTDEVYGSLGFDEVSSTENSKYDPSSPYSASKAASDLLVNAWIKTYSFPALITHCTNNYGEHQHDEKLIPTIVRSALQGEIIPIYGQGQNIRDWLYVKDHCEALIAIFFRGQIGETYNISASVEKPNNEIAAIICDYLDEHFPQNNQKSYRDQIKHVNDRLGHDLRYSLSHEKITQELSWNPQTSFKSGLSKTLNWYAKKYLKGLSLAKRAPLIQN